MNRWQIVAHDRAGGYLMTWGRFWTRGAAEREAAAMRSPIYVLTVGRVP